MPRRSRRRMRRRRRKALLHHQHTQALMYIGRMCWWQPPASTAFPPLQLHHHHHHHTVQGSAGTRNATTHTHKHTHSHIQAYTGLPPALRSFLCTPKITDLMAYLFPSGWTWLLAPACISILISRPPPRHLTVWTERSFLHPGIRLRKWFLWGFVAMQLKHQRALRCASLVRVVKCISISSL